MAEYIEREALLKYPIRLDHYDKEHGNKDFVLGIESVMEYAEALPAADVVEVKHGRWTENERIMYDSVREEEAHWFTYVCSVCNGEVMNNTNYCPNCGARMDGDA